jgi:methylthioribulose-1-phosphate dehydratase
MAIGMHILAQDQDRTDATALIAIGGRLDARGYAPATGGNYSVRLDDGSIAITASGTHKGRLTPGDIMRVSATGEALDARRPSAETLLHCLVYAVDPGAGSVLHTHSIAGTVLSRALAGHDHIVLEGYELLKIFPGIATHDTRVAMPLVDNSQDMPALAAQLRPLLEQQAPLLPAFYIRGHGLYAWASTPEAAEHVVEACEFLLRCAWEEWKMSGGQA